MPTSAPVTITGLTAASPITVSGAATSMYNINGGAFTSAPGTVVNGDVIRAKHVSAPGSNTAVDTTVTIGGVADTFTSTTGDATPDVFSFVDQTNVPRSTVITSAPVTLAGMGIQGNISVTGGEYSINGGAFTAVAGLAGNGDLIRARHTSAATYSVPTNTIVEVQGISDTFTSTTEAMDTAPNAFTFVDVVNQNISTTVTSAAITVSGINTATSITVTGGEYNINGGTFTAAPGAVNNGDTVQARHTSSANSGGVANTVVTIGGVSDTFSSTTGDATPDQFTFVDQTGVAAATTITSAAVVLAGMAIPGAITVSGDPSSTYSVNAGPFVSTAGTVSNADSIRARHTASAAPSTVVNTIVTVQGVSDTFSSTTTAIPAAPDTTPDPFTFADQTGVPLSS